MNEKLATNLKKYYDHIIFLRLSCTMPDLDMDIMYYDMVKLCLEIAGKADRREAIENIGKRYVDDYVNYGIRPDLKKEIMKILNE